MKRFAVTGLTRDREYNLTPGQPGTRVVWFSANPNGEAEVVKVVLKPKARLVKLQIDVISRNWPSKASSRSAIL